MNVVMLGLPGAGKGTQSKWIELQLGLRHLSTGDLLRSEKQRDTPLGRLIAERIDRGNYVTDELAISLVAQAVNIPVPKGYVFDGVPRTISQDRMLSDLLAQFNMKIDLAIELQVSREVARTRLSDRASIEGRTDDTAETIGRRLEVYEAETAPLIDHYRTQGILRTVDGRKTPDEVLELLRESLGEITRGSSRG
jgi:adenylate kinase